MAYDASVIAAFEFENNKNDSVGAHVLAEFGAAHTFSNTIFHDGAYSMFTTANYYTNTSIPTALAASSFTIEMWTRPSADNVFTSPIYAGGGNFMFYYLPSLNQLQVSWAGVNLLNEYNFATEKETWIHLAFTFDAVNGVFKFYKNNVLKFTKTSTTNQFTGTMYFGVGTHYFTNGYIDNFIISNTVKTSFPTVKISEPTITSCSSPKYTYGGETITVGGTAFAAGAVVNINGVNLATTFVSATSVTAITQAITAGTYDVKITNTDTGTATLTNGITFINSATTLTNVSPASGATQGGGVMTITGTGFTATGVIYIDGLAVTTTYISATILQCTIPAHAAGGVTIQVIDGASVLTWTYSFIYIVGAPEDYTVLINGKDVTGVQIKRFTQKNEINFIDRTNLSFNNIEITAPFNIINLFYKDNNNDIVTVRRNAVALFKGYISAKEKDYSTQIYYITASQLLSLTGKTNAALADAGASAPVARMVKLLTDYLPVEYTAPQTTGLDAYFAGISILLNTGTSDTKLLDVILSICELLDLAIFIDDNLIIKIIPLPLAFSNGKDITEALASLPVIKEKKEYYYNAVSLKYYATVGGAEATATAGSGQLALNLSFSNIYFDAASAALITARKLALRNKIYFEAEFTVNKTVILNIGDSFAFDIYNFIVIYKEETLTSFKIRGLGAEK